MRISDWSSDVCSSDLLDARTQRRVDAGRMVKLGARGDDVAAGFEQTAELIGVDRLRHVDHAIRLQREDLVDIARRLDADRRQAAQQNGRASCRESVCQYGSIPGVAVSFKKTTKASKRPKHD